MKIYVKNMVCALCKTAVKTELTKLNIEYSTIELGSVEINRTESAQQINKLNVALKKCGLEVIKNPESILVEKIVSQIISLVYYHEGGLKIKLSCHLAEKLNCSYDYLSHVFKKSKRITIEHFFIAHKIKRVKELTIYNELSLSEIAHKLHYSSLAHLSCQFKKITGITYNEFKNVEHKHIDDREILIS